MYLTSLTLVLVLTYSVDSKPQNFNRFFSQSPDDLSKSLELLENPYVAAALVNSNKNKENQNNQFPFEENLENSDLFNLLIGYRPRTTTAPPWHIQQYHGNPYFISNANQFHPQPTLAPRPQSDFNYYGQPTFESQDVPQRRRRTNSSPRISRKTTKVVDLNTAAPTVEVPLLSLVQPAVRAPNPPVIETPASETPAILKSPDSPERSTTAKPVALKRISAVKPGEEYEKVLKKQAESAKYMFESEIDDTINGNVNQRVEVRDGVNVKGKYSYSDGYFKRTVHYEADDKGYRVVQEEVEPIGDGPQINPDGYAKVSANVDGTSVKYAITNDDIQSKKQIFYRQIVDYDTILDAK